MISSADSARLILNKWATESTLLFLTVTASEFSLAMDCVVEEVSVSSVKLRSESGSLTFSFVDAPIEYDEPRNLNPSIPEEWRRKTEAAFESGLFITLSIGLKVGLIAYKNKGVLLDDGAI